jgi:hypothetical protein
MLRRDVCAVAPGCLAVNVKSALQTSGFLSYIYGDFPPDNLAGMLSGCKAGDM